MWKRGTGVGILNNPEEVNRIVIDHVSQYLMCCTESAVEFLRHEGITENVYLIGDPMLDAFCYYADKVGSKPPEVLSDFDGKTVSLPEQLFYLTCYREENAGSEKKLLEILTAMNSLTWPCVYPVHPRNQAKISELRRKNDFCKHVGYLLSIFLTKHAEKIVTDSGGLQREAFFAGKQCVTLFDRVIWPETMIENWNQLSSADCKENKRKLSVSAEAVPIGTPFGDGHSAEKIVETLKRVMERSN